MRLLLDTHVWLWSLLEPARISRHASRKIARADSERWLSPVSLWEACLLCEKKRLDLRPDPRTWILSSLESGAFLEATFTHAVALEAVQVRLPHRDPADRYLVATARHYDLTLVTADERLLQVPGLRVLSAR